jgi:hypothetical protein
MAMARRTGVNRRDADGADVWPPAKMAIPSTTKNDYFAWSSPLVFGGNVYVGISSQCDRPLVRAGLDRFSQATGTLEKTFWTTPLGTRGSSNSSAGPVWQSQIGNPHPMGPGQCDAAPDYDGSHLYLASDGTTINGTAYDGSLRRVNPATGAVAWETGLTGSLIGTPGMDGKGVIAAASFGSTTNQNGVFLINASNGQILKTIPYAKSNTFGQPVFADNFLFVASTNLGLRAYAPR